MAISHCCIKPVGALKVSIRINSKEDVTGVVNMDIKQSNVEKKENKRHKVSHHCKKPDHIQKYCYKLKDTKENKGFEGKEEYALIAKTTMNYADEVWFADSGASKHMTNSPTGLFDVVTLSEKIVIGNNQKLTCEAKGKLRVKIKISKVEYIQILLEGVLYVPEIKTNLFSLSDVTKRKDVKVNIEGDKVIIGGPMWGPWSLFIRSKNETLYHMDCERVVSIDAACAFIENEKLDSSVKEKSDRNKYILPEARTSF